MRILIVSTLQNVFLQDNGGSLRIFNLLEQLRLLGNEIYVLQRQRFGLEGEVSGCQVYTFREMRLKQFNLIYLADFNLHLMSQIRKIIRKEKIDLIQVSYPWGVISVSIFNHKIPVVYDCHNIESDMADFALERRKKDFSRFKPLQDIIKRCILSYVHWQEKQACRKANLIICVNDRDIKVLTQKFALECKKFSKIPIGIDCNRYNLLASKEELKQRLGLKDLCLIIFHATFEYDPNQEALEIITSYIAPQLKKIDSRIRLILTGKGIKPYKKENIISLGLVEDIASVLGACDVTIVPLLHGSGTRVKILESFAAGIPVVTTKKGIEGIELKDKHYAIITEGVDEIFIRRIIEVTRNAGKHQEMIENAKAIVRENYDWQKTGILLDNLYQKIIKENKNNGKE